MCTELLPPGGYPTAVKYIIYHIKSSIKFHPCCCLPVLSCVSRSMLNSLFLCIKSSFTHRTHSPSSIIFSTLNFFFDFTGYLTFVHFPPAGKSFTLSFDELLCFILTDVRVLCYQPSLSSLNPYHLKISKFCFSARNR